MSKECKIILKADSVWAKRLGLAEDTVFESKQELVDLLNQTARSRTNDNAIVDLGGITKMLTHKVSNINAGIQQDATHSTIDSQVILPSQMFNAFTFKGYSQREVNEIYNAIADIAVRGLTGTFFKDERPASEIKSELLDSGYDINTVDTEVKRLKQGESVNFASLVASVVETDNTEAKEKMIEAYREILVDKAKQGEDFSLFEVLTETFDAMGMPIDNQHMFNSAVSELANKFSKEAIKIKFDGQFAVLKPGSGSQQVYEISEGRMPYKDGMTIKYRPVIKTEVVTRERAVEWAKANNVNIDSLTPRNLRGQYVTLVDSLGKRTQISMASGEQLIPEAVALTTAKKLIDKYKGLSTLDSDHTKLYKDFIKELKALPEESGVNKFIDRYLDQIPDEKLKSKLKKGNKIENIFLTLNPEASYFTDGGAKELKGDDGKLLYFAKINTLGKVLTSELNRFMSEAAEGVIPASLQSDLVNNESGHKIEISRAEVIVDLTARDKFLIREGDDIGDITEELFYNRLLEGAKNIVGVPYHGAERMLQSGEQKILFHYGKVPAKFDNNTTDQAEWDPVAKQMNVYGTPEGGTADKLLFSLQGETSIRIIDGNMHIFLNNTDVANAANIQSRIIGKADSNFKRVQNYLGSKYTIKSIDLTVDNSAAIAEEQAALASKAKRMYNSWLKYLDVIGTRIPGQHYQSFQGLRIVGFAKGNKIFVPNEVTMLAGSDFDIDKMNMIYYSIDNDGILSKWHPAFNYDTLPNINLSMKLPLPIGRKKADFMADIFFGTPLEEVVQFPENFNIDNIADLVWLYDQIKSGKKLGDGEFNNAIGERLEQLDSKTNFKITPKGINNFTISRANAVINNPKNYPLLQKPVSMASPQLLGSMSKEGKDAKNRSKEQPSSIVMGKYDNMVGKDMIAVVASSGLKAFSGITSVYNKALMDLDVLAKKLRILNTIPITDNDISNAIGAKMQEINDEIAIIIAGFPSDFSVANLNFENVSPEVLAIIKPRFKPNNVEFNEQDFIRDYILQNMMESLSDDAAEIKSELLSAATDNAKELILAKIRAVPEFGTIYTALLAEGVPFWKIVQIMTSPATDFYMRHFDKEPFKAKHLNFESILDMIINRTEGVSEKLKDNKKLTKKELSAFNRFKENLLKDYGFEYKIEGKTATLNFKATNDSIDIEQLKTFKKYLTKGKEMQILGKYLGINQGIKAKAFELYSFTKTIENHLFTKYGITFNFTSFLNSLNGDKSYANRVIGSLSVRTDSGFNLLYVLANATNFEKQLQGFSITNQMLSESTYKMNAVYHISTQLEGYATTKASALSEDQFNEVQRFIDNTVLLKFFNRESKTNSNVDTRPIFYNGDIRLDLSTKKGRLEFTNWMHDKFIPRIKNMAIFNNNEFVRDLTYETVNDSLYSEKVPIIRMTYDTTNAISEETKSKADNYKFNLNLLRYGYDKDPSEPTANNVFNALFWYNTLVNKGGVGKYSWAKMQNELIIDDEDHPFRRLTEMQGDLGKATSFAKESKHTISVNDIRFNLDTLLKYHPIVGEKVHIGMSIEEEINNRSLEETLNFNDDLTEFGNPTLNDFFPDDEFDYDDDSFAVGLFTDKSDTVKFKRLTRKGSVGTYLTIARPTLIETVHLTDPMLIIPYDIDITEDEDLDIIAPADSARAIRELGARFKELNPNIDILYKTKRQLIELSNKSNYDYTNAKAFVLNGQVNINLNKASLSDVVHEYGHLFLHALKYESLEMYNNMIQLAVNHPRYEAIKANYPKLDDADLNEEVFITVFGESMRENLTSNAEDKELLLNFADYTKQTLGTLLNKEVDSIFDLSPREVANLTLEEAINILGDTIMKNRIGNIYNSPLAIVNEIAKLKDDLFQSGLLTESCG